MENSKRRLPISFFEKPRPSAPRDSMKNIIPIKWSKEVMNGKKQIIVTLPQKSK